MKGTLITSSVLILAILFLRPFLRRRVSPTAVYSLWAMVAVRLLVPWFSPFMFLASSVKSRLSVMNAVDLFQREVIKGSVMEPLADQLATGQVSRYHEPVPAAMQAAGIDWQLWIMVVWVLGGVFLALWMAVVNIRFMRRLRAARRPYTGTLPGFVVKQVYVVSELSSPCYFGVGSDEGIYLPEGIAEDKTAALHALAHESCHVAHGDRIWGTLRCMLLCYYWINPLIWLGAVWSRRDCELACDEAAVKLLGEEERYDYGRTLLGMVAGRREEMGLFLSSTTMTAGKRTIKERIQTLARRPRTTVSMAVVLAVLIIVLAACTFTEKTESAAPQLQAESQSVPETEAQPAPKDVLVLLEDNQRGNYCEIVLQRQDGGSGEPKDILSDPYSIDQVIDVTAYKDTKGQELFRGWGQGFGSSIEGKKMTLRIWNQGRAGSFKITVSDEDAVFEYFYVPEKVEPISEYTLSANTRKIVGPRDTSVWLKSVEEFPNALGIVLKGETQEEATEFYDDADILLKPVGARDIGDYIAPSSSGRDGMEIYLLYLFSDDIPPLSQVEALAVGRGISQEDFVETELDEYQISMTARQFVTAYMSGDVETAAKYSDIPGGRPQSETKEQSPGEGTLTTRWDPMDKETYAEGTYSFFEEGQADSLTYLHLAMKRVLGEWVVTEVWLEK